ncbi:hypothetical protein GCK32_010781 [Trichostrongylus colubriformis]|uniref:Transthyretin-like family protein n=1 Tax=Trichostrongylus colubriformis TaxID=6319 RepID=A0AAN8F8T4_TRICO
MNSPIILAILTLLQAGPSLPKEETVTIFGTLRCSGHPAAGITINLEDLRKNTDEERYPFKAKTNASGAFALTVPKARLFQTYARLSFGHRCKVDAIERWMHGRCTFFETYPIPSIKSLLPNHTLPFGTLQLDARRPNKKHWCYL